MGRLQQVIAELKRRRVFRALFVYAVAAFAILQVIEPVMHGLHMPEWVLSLVVVLLALGFPLTVGLAWAFDLKATGVERTPPAEPSPGSTRRFRIRVASLLLGLSAVTGGAVFGLRAFLRPPPPPPSVAVLAFADMSPSRDQEHFSDGIAEEILNALAQVEGLHVCGRTSSFSFKGKNEDLRVIGQKLGVETILEGSVRREGERIRITAQLVKTTNGFHLWSKTFDRDFANVFAVQEEIARAVVQALRVKLLTGPAMPARVYPSTNREAYQSYLLGLHFDRSFTADSKVRAIAALEKAVQLEPTYAPAWGALATSRLSAGVLGVLPWAEARRGGLSAANRAVELAPDLPSALAARARARLAEWDWVGAKADADSALERGQDDPSAISAKMAYLTWMGRIVESLDANRRFLELEPLDGLAWNGLGARYWYLGRFDEANQAFLKAIEVDPRNAFAVANRGKMLVDAGRPAEGLAVCAKAGPEDLGRLECEALAHHALGQPAESQKAVDAMLAEARGDRLFQIARVQACRGQIDSAFEYLERAYQEHVRMLNGLIADPCLRSQRTDPRWKSLLRKMNLPVE